MALKRLDRKWEEWVTETLNLQRYDDWLYVYLKSPYYSTFVRAQKEQNPIILKVGLESESPYSWTSASVIKVLGEPALAIYGVDIMDKTTYWFGPELQRKLDIAKEWGAFG